jgi:hypothetical protein
LWTCVDIICSGIGGGQKTCRRILVFCSKRRFASIGRSGIDNFLRVAFKKPSRDGMGVYRTLRIDPRACLAYVRTAMCTRTFAFAGESLT